MTLARPVALWLVPILVLSALLAYRRGQVRWRRVRLALAMGDGEGFGWLRLGTLVAASVFLGLGLAGPRLGGEPALWVASGVSAVLALDVSRSMTVRDVNPDRMSRARMAALRIASGTHARIGLVGFAAQGHLLLPPTEDRGLLALYVEALGPEITSAAGSNLASAVETALEAVGADSTRARHVVVISDGEGFEDRDDVDRVTALARVSGVRIHGLLVGSAEGGAVPGIRDGHSQTDVERLRALADPTGGSVFQEGEGGAAALVELFEEQPVSTGPVEVPRSPVDLTGWMAALALLALVAESLTAALRRDFAW